MKFVQTIYKQLEKETKMHLKPLVENAEKSHYYMFTTDEDLSVSIWSERYVLLYDNESTDVEFHQINLFDVFNDKNV